MTNEQIKNLLEKALQKSKKFSNNPEDHDLAYDNQKLVVQIELIISMLAESSKPITREPKYPYDNS